VSKDDQRIIDESLVRRSLEGDEDAFGDLVNIYQRRLTSYLYQLVGDFDIAQELSQESFIRAWSALDRFNPAYRFSTWLFRIGHNLAIDNLRKKRLKTISLHIGGASGDEREITPSDKGKNPLQYLENSEMGTDLRQAINSLRAEYRDLVLLRHFGGLSYQEIADFMKMPLGTIKNKLFRAHSVLRKEMAPHRK